MNKRRSNAKIPYEGYELPPVAERGGQFVDFNKVINRKVVKRVKKKNVDRN